MRLSTTVLPVVHISANLLPPPLFYMFYRADSSHLRWRCLAQVGAQVMLLKNLELDTSAKEMLVNGSRGVVTSFKTKEVRASV